MLKAAEIFGSHMVLQRQKEICVWGTSSPHAQISGRLLGMKREHVTVEADKNGRWCFCFPAQEAQRNVEIMISDAAEECIFTDVCIGEVWIAGGQSNMEHYLQFDEHREEAFEEAPIPEIRFFDTPKISYTGQEEEFDYSRFGYWRTGEREDLPYYSAVGYYFARQLSEHLDVPVGIIGCNWGGTPACAWLDEVLLKGGKGEIWLQDYWEQLKELDIEEYTKAFKEHPNNDKSNPLGPEVLDGMWGKVMYPGLSREEQLEYMKVSEELLPLGPLGECRPGGLYQTMLCKIAPYTVRGVIWYQGESDSLHPEAYTTVLEALTNSWRRLWKDNIPFFMVQLAPFGKWLDCAGDDFYLVREEQARASEAIEGVWLCSASDAGMEWDIHPKEKKPIGIRLSLLARHYIYGEDILCEAPQLESARRVIEGIEVKIKYAEGLYCKGENVTAFTVADDSGHVIVPEEIRIVGDRVLIKGEFPLHTKVSFARTAYYKVNVYNAANLPMMPFVFVI